MTALVWGGTQHYLILQADSLPDLVVAVNEHQALGWEPIGGVAIGTWPDSGYLLQAMGRITPPAGDGPPKDES